MWYLKFDSRVLTAISGLQDAVERQRLDYQNSLQQLQRTMEEQEKQLTKLNDCEYLYRNLVLVFIYFVYMCIHADPWIL